MRKPREIAAIAAVLLLAAIHLIVLAHQIYLTVGSNKQMRAEIARDKQTIKALEHEIAALEQIVGWQR